MTNFGEVPVEMEGFKGILGKILDKKIKDGKCLNVESKNEMEFSKDGKLCFGNAHCGVFELNDGIKNGGDERIVGNGNKGGRENVEVNGSSDFNVARSFENVSEQRITENCKNDDLISHQIFMEENEGSRKRKRDCYSSMIKWIIEVSKDPCDPAIGSLPERCRWKSYGNDHLWKQVLMVRETLLLRRNADSSTQSFWQNKPMHPAMYEDPSSSDGLRYSQRLLYAKESVNKSCRRIFPDSSSSATGEDLSDKVFDSTADSTADLWVSSYRQKRVPLGPNFQADVPEWNGETQGSDSKWLGTRIWPLKEQNKRLIERERIGKGRQDSCGCSSLGSVECVRFHVAEKRTKVKLELGTAFYMFKFQSMGEDVAFSWLKEEQKKFQDIVESNRLSQGKCFWSELLKGFSSKDRESLVRYYFNVFLLRLRGTQNRTNPSNIDSDDDEAESISDAVNPPPGSIFCSPKKVHLNSR